MQPFESLKNEEFLEKRKEIMRFLPDEIIDFQCHMWKAKDRVHPPSKALLRSHPLEFFPECDYNYFKKIRETLFPEKRIRSFIHPPPTDDMNFVKANEYVLKVARSDKSIIPCLSALKGAPEEVVDQIRNSRARGVKTISPNEMIYGGASGTTGPLDYIDRPVLQALDDTGKVLIIHTDRSLFENKRNVEHIKLISYEYPNIKIAIAHLGLSFYTTNLAMTLREAYNCHQSGAKIFFETSQSPHHVFDSSPSLSKWPPIVESGLYNIFAFGSDMPFLSIPWIMTAIKDKPYSFVKPDCKYYDAKRNNNARDKWIQKGNKINLPYTYYSILEMHRAITEQCTGDRSLIKKVYERIYNGTAKEILGL